MRLVRSKLRKRDEPRNASSNVITEDKEHLDDNGDDADADTETNTTMNNCSSHHVSFVRMSGGGAAEGRSGHPDVIDIPEWTFPPKAPAPHIYHINPEMLIANDKNSFKGFRKQFSGRFKRLVARKLEPAPVIPPELKPQLKTIYVY
ncbi:GH18037 [Drosophila grimshawi]|uniref:GH18037 n=2 Tax=Drosophila grimshawi TaxID=7222 RepID=B4JHR1_DROGR|nr:GH18037 [Drosophila grimshawi]